MIFILGSPRGVQKSAEGDFELVGETFRGKCKVSWHIDEKVIAFNGMKGQDFLKKRYKITSII